MPADATIAFRQLGYCRQCDEYTLTVHADGKVVLNGRDVVSNPSPVSPGTVRALWKRLHDADFFEKTSRRLPRDGGGVELRATWGDDSWAVRFIKRPDHELTTIGETMERLAQVERHLRPSDERIRGL